MRVLYVEDNETNQALVGRVMRARQHTVLFREDGEGALAVLAEDPTIDLILMDVELAGSMSGLDAVKLLRDRGDMRPIVAVTAYAMMGDRERILQAGCDQYLPKPIAVPDLLALLDHYADADGVPASTRETAEVAAVAPTPSTPEGPGGGASAAPSPPLEAPAAAPDTPPESPTAPSQTAPPPPALRATDEDKPGANGANVPEPVEEPLAEAQERTHHE